MKTLAVIALMLAACGAEEQTTATLPSPAGAAQLDAAALAAHSLGVNSLSEMRLLATPGGRDVLARVVSCALPIGASITAITGSGTPYSFSGRVGLAPGWAQRPATAGERHRVTDCVLGRAPAVPAAPATINRV